MAVAIKLCAIYKKKDMLAKKRWKFILIVISYKLINYKEHILYTQFFFYFFHRVSCHFDKYFDKYRKMCKPSFNFFVKDERIISLSKVRF